jgi:hypothetical protein
MRLVRREVAPAAEELHRESESLRYRYVGAAARALVSVKPMALVGTIFVGVPPEVALLAAGAATAADAVTEALVARREVSSHGLSFLIDPRVS